MPPDALSQSLDRLYTVPLEEFLASRKQLAAELRSSGDVAASKAVAAAPKPTRTAWALNQVSRRQPELPRALLRARDLAFAPASGDGDAVRHASRDYRERLGDIVRAARQLLAEVGVQLNTIQARRMTETLQAACGEEGEARKQLLSGTLVRDLEADDPLALLAAAGAGPTRRGPDPALARHHEEQRVQRERRSQAVAAARAKVAELEGVAREALARLRAAQTEAERARRATDEADARLAEAREMLARLEVLSS
jgi:hypothetical protein